MSGRDYPITADERAEREIYDDEMSKAHAEDPNWSTLDQHNDRAAERVDDYYKGPGK